MMYGDFAYFYDKLMYDLDYEKIYKFVKEVLEKRSLEPKLILEMACGFRVIIVIEANSYVNIRSSRLLPKFKTQKINGWCAA